MEDDLRLNLYSSLDLKNEHNTKEIMDTFDRYFFAFDGFPAINELTIIPIGDVPSFFPSSDIFYLLSYIKKLVRLILED